MTQPSPNHPQDHGGRERSFWRHARRALLRGLGVVLPSLLTVIFLLWLWNAISSYVLRPIETLSRQMMVSRIAKIHYDIPTGLSEESIERDGSGRVTSFRAGNVRFVPLASGEWIPQQVYEKVRRRPGKSFPTTAEAVYNRYVESRWFRPGIVVAVFFAVFITLIYLVGRFIAARIGAALFAYFERLIDRLPLISTVYGTVKQVTDIVFIDEKVVPYNRVVAVQYPREGIWSLGFVTGESFQALAAAVNEPVLSVLMPTSPMPATGFTITVRKRDVVDLNISLDQAFQFIVSCGVVTDRSRAVINEPGANAPWSPTPVIPPVNPGSSTPSPH